jgi:hypothetical protein
MNYPKICSLIGELKLIGQYLDSWARSILAIEFLYPTKITAATRPRCGGTRNNRSE